MSAALSPDARLGELLVKANLVTAPQLRDALERVKKTGGPLSHELVLAGVINENAIVQALHKKYGVPAVDLTQFEIDPKVLRAVPREVVDKHTLIPINGATADELKREAIRGGMRTLRMSALEHLKSGLTSVDEVVRVTSDD